MVRRMGPTAARLLATALLTAAPAALAQVYDFNLRALGSPIPGTPTYDVRANGNFRSFARSLAADLVGSELSPSRTPGMSGTIFVATLSVLGTPQTGWPTSRPATRALLLPGVRVRKGLPGGFEVWADASWLEQSQTFLGRGGLRFALTEGLGYAPDVILTAQVGRVFGARDVDVGAALVGLTLGKGFSLGGVAVLSPVVGYGLGGAGAQSALLDFDEGRGQTSADNEAARFTGKGAFEPVYLFDNLHHRIHGGLSLRASVFFLSAEFAWVLGGQFYARDEGQTRSQPSQWVFSSGLGAWL